MNNPIAEMDTSLGERFARTPEEMDGLRRAGVAAAKRMLSFIDASPTPYHAAENISAQLREDGFQQLNEGVPWTLASGDRRFVIRDAGTLIAFIVGNASPPPTKPNGIADITSRGWE